MNNLNNLKMVELYKIASELKIKSYKKLNKVLLVGAITYAQNGIDDEGNDTTEEVIITLEVLKETVKAVTVTRTQEEKPFSFRFDNNRANVGDRFMKRMGEDSYVPMKVVAKDDKNTLLQTRSGIKIKIKNKKGS